MYEETLLTSADDGNSASDVCHHRTKIAGIADFFRIHPDF